MIVICLAESSRNKKVPYFFFLRLTFLVISFLQPKLLESSVGIGQEEKYNIMLI